LVHGASFGGYSRDLFPTWLDVDGNGCDASEDVLIAESLVSASVGSGCAVIGGRWLSLCDGMEVVEPSRLGIDHMVPLAERGDRAQAAGTPPGGPPTRMTSPSPTVSSL